MPIEYDDKRDKFYFKFCENSDTVYGISVPSMIKLQKDVVAALELRDVFVMRRNKALCDEPRGYCGA